MGEYVIVFVSRFYFYVIMLEIFCVKVMCVLFFMIVVMCFWWFLWVWVLVVRFVFRLVRVWLL